MLYLIGNTVPVFRRAHCFVLYSPCSLYPLVTRDATASIGGNGYLDDARTPDKPDEAQRPPPQRFPGRCGLYGALAVSAAQKRKGGEA